MEDMITPWRKRSVLVPANVHCSVAATFSERPTAVRRYTAGMSKTLDD